MCGCFRTLVLEARKRKLLFYHFWGKTLEFGDKSVAEEVIKYSNSTPLFETV